MATVTIEYPLCDAQRGAVAGHAGGDVTVELDGVVIVAGAEGRRNLAVVRRERQESGCA